MGGMSFVSNPVPGVSGRGEVVKLSGFDNAGSLGVKASVKGGQNRNDNSIVMIIFEGATLPPEIVDVGPFKFIQGDGAVYLLIMFAQLVLPRTVYPFQNFALVYATGSGPYAWMLRGTVQLDKTLLPPEVAAANLGARMYCEYLTLDGARQISSFYYDFGYGNYTTSLGVAAKSAVPDDVNNLPMRVSAELTVPYQALHVYEATWGGWIQE